MGGIGFAAIILACFAPAMLAAWIGYLRERDRLDRELKDDE